MWLMWAVIRAWAIWVGLVCVGASLQLAYGLQGDIPHGDSWIGGLFIASLFLSAAIEMPRLGDKP